MLGVFTKRDSDITPAAQRFINTLPHTYINLFRKKRRLLPVWSSSKYCVTIKSTFLVYYLASESQSSATPQHNRFLDLSGCVVKTVDDNSAGYVFTLTPATGRRTVTFVADNEKDRTAFVNQVAAVQRTVPTLSDFSTLSLIGKGHYGRVILCKNKTNQQVYALKEMKLGSTKQKVIHTERMVMEWAGDHPFVLGLDYAFGSGRSLYLISKFMEGGDLFLHMQKRGGGFSESAIRFYASELLLALQHLHAVNIIHRDIKPENVLLDSEGHIKLADMGLAKRLEATGDRSNTMCGTDAYLAPEMVSRNPAGHGLEVDLWQLGCLLYELYVGHPPFYTPNSSQRQTHHRILYQSPRYPQDISRSFRSLLSSLLCKVPEDRLGVAEVKEHEFFSGIDWSKVRRKEMMPPVTPEAAGSDYVNNFDTQFTQQPFEIRTIEGMSKSRDFVGFDYINPDLEESLECFKKQHKPKIVEFPVTKKGDSVSHEVNNNDEERLPEVTSTTTIGKEKEVPNSNNNNNNMMLLDSALCKELSAIKLDMKSTVKP